ncbi:MAG TPA: tetratricopeptide repeat protein [Rhodanobacteraceae bacterium]|nr:tetratricopeptide repeat protein [Rhodanobacteraceae bacterium]
MIPDLSAQTVETLRQASTLLQAGRHAPARGLLDKLIRTQPGCAEAHRMLAMSLCQTGEFVRAQKVLRTGLSLHGDDIEALVLLGRALSATGQVAEALRVLQDASRQDPANVPVACSLGRVLLTQGRVEDALRVLQQAVDRSGSATPELWMLLGHARMTHGQPVEAAEAFREWLRLEPGSADARMRLAAALADAQQPVEAEAEIRRCMAAGARTPEITFVLARALMGQGRFDEAEVAMRDVVRERPGHLTAQQNLSELVWMRTGDIGAACAELDAALQKQPDLRRLWITKARLLVSARQAPQALAAIDQGLAVAGGDPDLLRAAATIALDVDGARALEFAQRALRVTPDDRAGLVAFGNASLAVGQAPQALETAVRLHESDPMDGQALAMMADALRMLGDGRYRELLDYQGLVRAELLDVPDGWPDLDAYLADLVGDVRRLHTSRAHPIGNSLREGSQVGLAPQQSPFASIRAFPQAIDGPIRRYMEAIGHGADPMRCRNTGRYGISGMWSVRLRPHGFHVNHYHPQGWISSACYLHLPPAVQNRGGEGWLKFGETAFPTSPVLGPEYFIKPEPGLLALFPSYMWHGTVPFSGAPENGRLTVAFDVMAQS